MQQEFKQSIDRAINNANHTGALGKFSEAYKVAALDVMNKLRALNQFRA